MTETTRPHALLGKMLGALACALLAGTLLAAGLSGCFGPPAAGDGPADTAREDAAGGGPAAEETTGGAVKEGGLAPDFEFSTVDGTTAKLSDYRGRAVLLNFWATWCGYCLTEMPDMQEISEEYPDVAILAITRSDDSATAKRFIQEKGYDFIWGFDEDNAIARLYPANGIPYSVIIDTEGRVTAIFEGSAPEMYNYFKAALLEAGA
ncbi:MAG: TlpA family protein disulfide reductase [Eggerthellaceae bacterium]|nr:TlpA family protein disulfide reductase [Eggerthellaceae bacterium]